MTVEALNRRLSAAIALCALIAFISGAGMDAPLALPAGLLLVVALVWQPSARAQSWIEPVLRVLALLLALRAGITALRGGQDVVAPMVDLLLLLLAAEALRADPRAGAARLYTLSFALLVAASAYRPGLVFGVAFVSYIVLLTLALTVGHIARRAPQGGRRVALPGRFLLLISALSGIVLLTSAAVFVTFPRVTRSWMAGGAPVVQSVVGFSDVVSLGEHGATIASNPEVVLRVEFPDGPPPNPSSLHWRGRSYDRFDGVRWLRTQNLLPLPPHRDGARDGRIIRQLVYARPLGAQVVFGLHPLLNVEPRSRIWPIRESNGDIAYLGRASPVYLVSSSSDRLTPEQLRRSVPRIPMRGVAAYLQVPPGSERIDALADSLTRGLETQYDRAARIERWLQSEFRYTRELPRTARETSLEYFLLERRAGHCEYFSSAMVIMLRTLGIPARNVNGFLGGDWNAFGEYLAVSQNNAHSWVEVWFPGAGWVEFDPTPAASDEALTAGARSPWMAWLDGFEHRWNKWVLDYALEDQISLMERVADPFGDGARSDAVATQDIDWRTWLVFALVAVAVWFAAHALRVRRAGGAASAESRSYRRLRRAYDRSGSARASASARTAAPLAFAEKLRAENAPGAADAAAAIRLYVRARFGRQPLSSEERASLDMHVRAALSALRASRRSWTAANGSVASSRAGH